MVKLDSNVCSTIQTWFSYFELSIKSDLWFNKKKEKCKSVYLCFPYNVLKGIENVISSDPRLKKYWDV